MQAEIHKMREKEVEDERMVLRLAGMDPASGAVWATSEPLWVRPTGSWRRRRRPRAPDPRLPGCRLVAPAVPDGWREGLGQLEHVIDLERPPASPRPRVRCTSAPRTSRNRSARPIFSGSRRTRRMERRSEQVPVFNSSAASIGDSMLAQAAQRWRSPRRARPHAFSPCAIAASA